jgi:putative addiction module killer protein
MEIRQTEHYERWFHDLRDLQARARILVRIRRLSLGNPGDNRHLGGGICELKIPHGPGYRVYYVQRGGSFVLLLCGGDKNTQERDIEAAKEIARCLEG